MRYLKFYTTIILMFVGFIGFAQSKVAHIDSQALISEMPEVIEAQAQIEKLQKTYQTEIEASMKEYQTKLQTYSADAQNQTEVTNQARQKELQVWNKTFNNINKLLLRTFNKNKRIC